ncbi:SNF2 family N-terminal domain-containing protein [Neohortaea acidophila]|uniref:SNF2 family N-terminal domain-containing protein n=1 Tax=Neohortaea acidophila TaxID=245834 RepID=A0A6A6Q0G3_9PEZI|nr:SNF2 family N-terminal domain-containing protein [Neohortaea acidophila]KAF2485484.1 SNF2 family N-terminal domain-containing protein [Neohortaea acidophila]
MSTGSGGKRGYDVIDLTDDEPPAKIQRHAANYNAQRRPNPSQNDASSYLTPPASSAPRWSQESNNSFVYPQASSQQHSRAEREAWLAPRNDRARIDLVEEDDDDDDYFAAIPSTQAASVNTESLHHYGDLPTKIVGVQYYRGYASAGEQVLFKREPGNPYDRNAIRCDNVANTQMGHIPRRIAAKLSKFMDNSFLHVEGELAGEMGQFDCAISVRMYGPDPQSEEGVLLAAEMKAEKLPLNGLKAAEKEEQAREKAKKEAEKKRQREEQQRIAEARRAAALGGTGLGARSMAPPSQNGWSNSSQAGPNAQPVMADILEASQRFNPREIGHATDQYGNKEEALKNMPLADQPKGIRTQMLPYQLQALSWLLDREHPQLPPPGSKQAVQLWKRSDRQGLFTNLATTFSVKEPVLTAGGILADDMGLGKTIEMIALLAADKEKSGQKCHTLIVAPLSVLSNWKTQIETHCHENSKLSVYIHHGAGRVASAPADFQQYDVVVTTYQTLATEYMPKGKNSASKQPERKLRSSGLYSVHWNRVILDEGHVVRNPVSKVAGAVTALLARSKWALTGTPIVNSLKDLYSLLRFIGITGGLENLEIFNRVLVRPLKQGDPSATFLLQAIMTAFTLRRRKEMAFIDLRLPKLDEFVHRIDFTTKERERYDALNAEAQGLLQRYENKAGQQGKGAGEAFQHLLEILLRMRQCCNHWQLCGERITNLLAQLEEQKTVDLTPENKKALQDILQLRIQSQEDCAICLDTLHSPVITTCGHSFGQDCISKVIETQKRCPMCRAELKDDTCLVQPANECGDDIADDEMDLTQSSSKLEAMMEILAATKSENGKTIIFSQWTRFLDIVQARLDRDGYTYCRIDGTMPAAKRDEALRALAEDSECTVMLASLGVCAVGLNLTAANQVILSDTWWAPAIEDQAVDRVHRLGQKKETRVFRLVMDKSIEDETIRVQQEKRKLAQLAFSERAGKRENAKTGRLADIQRLLRPAVSKEANKDK